MIGRKALPFLISRCAKPIFESTDDIKEAAQGLIALSPFFGTNEVKKLVIPLKKFSRRDPALLTSSFDVHSLDVKWESDGRRLGTLLRAVPPCFKNDDFWNVVADVVRQGLLSKVWRICDCHWMVKALVNFEGIDNPAFIEALSDYLMHQIEKCLPEDVPFQFMVLNCVPSLRKSDLLFQACNKVASLENLSVGSIGLITYYLNRLLYVHHNLAIAVQEEADRIAESGDLFAAVNVFYFIARHESQHISTESLQWLAESLLTGEMDCETVITVSSALSALPKQTRRKMRQEIFEVIVYLSGQVVELLNLPVAEGGFNGELSMDSLQIFLSKFLHLSKCLLPPLTSDETEEENVVHQLPEEFYTACEKCALIVQKHAENLVSSENPPFSLIPHLLDSPSKAVQESGVAVLREMAKQTYHIPSLQTFRFVLLLGDHKLADAIIFKYLRNHFAKTSLDIPIVQLCAALKCFAPELAHKPEEATAHSSVEKEVDNALEAEQADAFFRYVKELVIKNVAVGIDFRCVMAIVETLLQLGCEDNDFFDKMISYMHGKMKAITPADQSSESAAVIVSKLNEDHFLKYDGLKSFLQSIVTDGKKDEALLTPSQWMNLHDPGHALLPLTEEQQEGWKIIDEMVLTRADNREALIELAKKYIAMLPQLRPDDSKFFFGVFEEKVLKEDILLKECLEQLTETGIVTKLSATTIAAILNSLSIVRFIYSRTVKDFLNAMSTEQWEIMEATPLVHLLAGLSKLSMRLPSLLEHIGRRINEIYRFMSPYDVSQCIHSLQALGFKDDTILMKLMEHAASSARSFDDGSLALLFSAPSVHRLFRKPELVLPLLQRAAGTSLSIRSREKLIRCLSKAPLPRELINSASTDLLSLEMRQTTLRLTASNASASS